MKEKAVHAAQSVFFRKLFSLLGILFILMTPFITLHPDTFTGFSYVGIAVFNMLSSGLVLLPTLIHKFNLIGLILVSAAGNIVNTSVNYFIGYSNNTLLADNTLVLKAKGFVERFRLPAVYFLAIVPLPLDVNGLISGYIGIPYEKYITVNFLGKVTVFMIVCVGAMTFAG